MTAGAQSALFPRLDGELRAAAIRAIVAAMQHAFSLVLSSGAVMTIAGAFIKRERLLGEIVTA